MSTAPTGPSTVEPSIAAEHALTFLMTDIEGSSRLWEKYPDAMRGALPRHDSLLSDAVLSQGGTVVKHTGDGFLAAFESPARAVAAALAAQVALVTENGADDIDLRVRMSLHTGPAEQRDGDYFGSTLNRTARLLAAAQGGQTLLTSAVRDAVRGTLPEGAALKLLGRVRLRDLPDREAVYQLVHPVLPAEFPPLRALETQPNNLPQELTSFVGRENELEFLRDLLGRTRLLTVVGMGGAGKTRIALKLAAEQVLGEGEGVYLVELAPIAEPHRVARAIADTLKLPEESGITAEQALIAFLGEREMLLVLDNCEQVAASCAALAGRILRACPHVRLLASSREPLGVAGEAVYRVPTLSLPDLRQNTFETVALSESARLFAARAAAVRPNFTITAGNSVAVGRICRRLDGIPLAIELAAARIRSLSLEEVGARLDDRFRILTGGSRVSPPRQQTLRALIDWSHDLLSPNERLLFSALSVFSDGWTREAAQDICTAVGVAEEAIGDLLAGLVDKSLVLADSNSPSSGGARYRMLETIREYAWLRLAEDPDRVRKLRDIHARSFLRLAEDLEAHRGGPEEPRYLERLAADQENIRSAIDSLGARREHVELRLRYVAAMARFWDLRGKFQEGRARLARALEQAVGEDFPELRFAALKGLAILCLNQGDPGAARAPLEEALAIAQRLGDRLGIATTLNSLGNVAMEHDHDSASARRLYSDSLQIGRELNHKRVTATALNNLGIVAMDAFDLDTARAYFEECRLLREEMQDIWGGGMSASTLGALETEQKNYERADSWYNRALAAFRQVGDVQSIAYCTSGLATTAYNRGDWDRALILMRESLQIRLETRDLPWVAANLIDISNLLTKKGRHEPAVRLYSAAAALESAAGTVIRPASRAEYAVAMESARAALGDSDFKAASEAGIAAGWERIANEILNSEFQ